jgi:uncharacterized protein
MLWLNEPPEWREEGGLLSVVTGDKTDFWRGTHYGFIRDDGHLRYRNVDGDFTATVAFQGEYRELYDQAGLMLRLDENNWIKAGVEFVDGKQMLSVVVTREFSDWSTMPLPLSADWLQLSLTRHDSAVRVEWTTEAAPSDFQLLRLAYLPAVSPALIGPMCCSPQRAGFHARFRDFEIGSAKSPDLHG